MCLFQVLVTVASFAVGSPEAVADPSPAAVPALVSHHDSPYLMHHHSGYQPTTPYPPYGHSTPVYGHSTPVYGHSTPAPGPYGYQSPTYGPSTPSYGHPSPPPSYHKPSYSPKHSAYPKSLKHHEPHDLPKHCGYKKPPTCSHNTTKSWCLEDYDYPEYEIKAALEYHKVAVLSLYADVADLNTANSVVRPNTLAEETYLCPSDTNYVRPLRVVNTEGKWKVIVNNIKIDYDTFSQTTRIEECLDYGKPCPLVPHCYESSCLQKSIYHRFLIYDPCDKYFPFAIDSFKLPASCACQLGAYYIMH